MSSSSSEQRLILIGPPGLPAASAVDTFKQNVHDVTPLGLRVLDLLASAPTCLTT